MEPKKDRPSTPAFCGDVEVQLGYSPKGFNLHLCPLITLRPMTADGPGCQLFRLTA
jgi:hypothetical protein